MYPPTYMFLKFEHEVCDHVYAAIGKHHERKGYPMKRARKGLVCIIALVVMLVLVSCDNSTSKTNASSGQEATTASEATQKEVGELPTINASLPTGSLISLKQPDEPIQLTEAETDRVNRAIRAYTPPAEDSLLKNKATSYYYYDQLKGDAKSMYEALIELYNDPTNDDAYFMVELKDDADANALMSTMMLSYLAIQYDHPEFFWAYNALETDIVIAQPYETSNIYFFTLDKPYKRYKKEMTAFNKATEEFLKDIDLSQSDYQIARAIHDKLIKTVTYDHEVADNKTTNDLAHTAYGALVEDSSGNEHYAVCDGYSQAFVYLLQQCGIKATVIVGNAGADIASIGGHAWSMVELDGEWYEVDSTWDDQGEWENIIAQAKEEDPTNEAIPYYEKAIGDDQYFNKLQHFLYNVTTDTITDYQPPTDYVYTFEDGAQLQLLEPSVHQRYTEADDPFFGGLMSLAPVATGTQYAFDGS